MATQPVLGRFNRFGSPPSVPGLYVSSLAPTQHSLRLEPLFVPSDVQTLVVEPIAPVNVPSIAAPVHPSAPATISMAEQILTLVNHERIAHQLSPLVLQTQLSASAQRYADLMQTNHFFSHVSPSGQTFQQRDEIAGYTQWSWIGENIAYGQPSSVAVMDAFMMSPMHKANILDVHATELGVGYAAGTTPYWVQEFGTQR
jgi:uncharacterized protein YkwD